MIIWASICFPPCLFEFEDWWLYFQEKYFRLLWYHQLRSILLVHDRVLQKIGMAEVGQLGYSAPSKMVLWWTEGINWLFKSEVYLNNQDSILLTTNSDMHSKSFNPNLGGLLRGSFWGGGRKNHPHPPPPTPHPSSPV